MSEELRPIDAAAARSFNPGKLRDLYLNLMDAWRAELDARDAWVLAHNMWSASAMGPEATVLHRVMTQALTKYKRMLDLFVTAEERYVAEKKRQAK